MDDDVFFGTLNSAAGASAGTNDDGTINAQKADVLTATYDDVVTALGDQLNRVDSGDVVGAFGDADGNGLVQAFDAAQILQHILVPPIVTLTGLELLAADVADPFGTVSPFDAAFILKDVVGLISTFPVQEATSENHPQNTPSSPKQIVETRDFVLAYGDGYVSLQADDRADILSGDVLLEGVEGQVQLGARPTKVCASSSPGRCRWTVRVSCCASIQGWGPIARNSLGRSLTTGRSPPALPSRWACR